MFNLIWRILSLVCGILIIFVLLLTSVELTAFNQGFYEEQFVRLNRAEAIGISETELNEVGAGLIAYLKGDRQDLDMKATINGEYREVFNTREKEHMVDVQVLFKLGLQLRVYAAIVIVAIFILLVLFKRRRGLRMLCNSILLAIIIFVGLAAFVTIYFSLDFNGAFTLFHLLFFTNDLWVLDPATDILINIVPLDFFMACAQRIITFFGIALLALAVIAYFGRRTLRRQY